MNNDLISREALKEHKFLTPQVKVIGGRHGGKLKEQIIRAYQKGWNDCIDAIIDNAPTVELTEEQAIDKLHETGWLPRHDKEMTERPQGEWIQSETDRLYHTNNWKCSNCHSVYVIWNSPLNHDYNFCPNCGARMGGEE